MVVDNALFFLTELSPSMKWCHNRGKLRQMGGDQPLNKQFIEGINSKFRQFFCLLTVRTLAFLDASFAMNMFRLENSCLHRADVN